MWWSIPGSINKVPRYLLNNSRKEIILSQSPQRSQRRNTQFFNYSVASVSSARVKSFSFSHIYWDITYQVSRVFSSDMINSAYPRIPLYEISIPSLHSPSVFAVRPTTLITALSKKHLGCLSLSFFLALFIASIKSMISHSLNRCKKSPAVVGSGIISDFIITLSDGHFELILSIFNSIVIAQYPVEI